MTDEATTVLEWTYEPMDLFEEPIEVRITSGSVHIEDGVARGHFPASEYERGAEFRDEAHRGLKPHFVGQAMIAGKKLVLNPAELTREYADGRRDGNVIMGSVHFNLSTFPATFDAVVRDKDGNVSCDSRAERLAEQEAFRTKVVNAMPVFPEIGGMAESLNRSFEDETNCFVHLYEVRDRIATMLEGVGKAKRALNAHEDWEVIDDLSNRTDNAFGRHRGKGTDHEKPDEGTLRKGRDATRRLIADYVDYVSQRR